MQCSYVGFQSKMIKKLLWIIVLGFVFLFSINSNANTKFIGQLDCKRSDVEFTWELKIDEEQEEVFVEHSDGSVYQYTYQSSLDEFYFSRYWFAKKMRHEFVVDRMSGEFETITTYDGVEKQVKFNGTCKKKERAF